MSAAFLFNSHKPGAKDSDTESGIQDAATPISSAGAPTQSYENAAGPFNWKKHLERKPKSRDDLDQPAKKKMPMRDNTSPEYGEGPLDTGGTETDDATNRYFGNFSIESKRHVWDLLNKHPKFDEKGNIRLNRVGNNTREILPQDPTKIVENGGYIIYENQPQASQENYD